MTSHALLTCSTMPAPPALPQSSSPHRRRGTAHTLRLGRRRLLGARDAFPVQLPADPCLAVKPANRAEGLSSAQPHSEPWPAQLWRDRRVVHPTTAWGEPAPHTPAPAGWDAPRQQVSPSLAEAISTATFSCLLTLWPRSDITRTASPPPPLLKWLTVVHSSTKPQKHPSLQLRLGGGS